MKLYTFASAPNPRRVHIFVAEKGIRLEEIHVDLMKGGQFEDEFKELNPDCTVPVLVTDDGLKLAQVPAICLYLEEVQPEPRLLGRTLMERVLVREWCQKIYVDGIGAVAEAFRNSTPGFKGRALPGQISFDQMPELVARGKARLSSFWKMLDKHLDGRDFVVGDAFSMADIDGIVTVDFAGWIKEAIPEECANVKRWYDAVSNRPSVKG